MQNKITINVELSEILDHLEGLFVKVTYLYDLTDIENKGLLFGKNILINKIDFSGEAHNFLGDKQSNNLTIELNDYLTQSNFYYSKQVLINNSTPSIPSSKEFKDFQNLLKFFNT